ERNPRSLRFAPGRLRRRVAESDPLKRAVKAQLWRTVCLDEASVEHLIPEIVPTSQYICRGFAYILSGARILHGPNENGTNGNDRGGFGRPGYGKHTYGKRSGRR